MRSNELAQIAGVSIRTLRYYHQIGLLEEPPRSTNGYRRYDTRALVTVLRIRRLVTLGFSLPQIASVLSDGAIPDRDVFEALDMELTAQIDQLSRQRELLSVLRRHEALPDLPPELAVFHELLRRSGLSDSAAEVDRDQTLLLTHLIGEPSREILAAIYDLLSRPERVADAAAAMTAWSTMTDASTSQQTDRLVDQLTTLFRDVIAELESTEHLSLPEPPEEWYRRHSKEHLNRAQEKVLSTVRANLEGPASTEGPGS